MKEYETIDDNKQYKNICPSCKAENSLSYSTMREEGRTIPVKVCSSCQYWF